MLPAFVENRIDVYWAREIMGILSPNTKFSIAIALLALKCGVSVRACESVPFMVMHGYLYTM